jgi:hypothetical protein
MGGHIAGVGGMKISYRILVERLEVRDSFLEICE